MEYIVSRHLIFPQTKAEMEEHYRYNLWKRRSFVYDILAVGDVIYWYETKTERVVWKTVVSRVERFDFLNSNEVVSKLTQKFDYFKPEEYFTDHFKNGEYSGICIAFTVKALERVHYDRPDSVRFPQLGWIKVNDETAREWFKMD